MNPNNIYFITDVQEFTGYENRNGTKKEIPSIEYLKDYERRLERKELIINETLIEIEKEKKIINEKNETLIIKEKELKELEKELKRKEAEWKETIKRYEKDISALKKEIEMYKLIIECLIHKNETSHSFINNIRKLINLNI